MPTVTYTAAETYTNYGKEDTPSVFGGEEDTWGATLTPEILNDPDFTLQFDVDNGAGHLRVDQVTVEVFFTLPAGAYDNDGLPPWATSNLTHGTIGIGPNGPQFMVVGQGGLIKTSTDGVTWTEQTSGTVNTLFAVAADAVGYTAVGRNGTVLTSANGSTWTTEAPATNEPLLAVQTDRSNLGYVAAGRNGVIRTKRRGGSWRPIRF